MNPEISALVEELIPQARSVAWRHYQGAPHALEREELVSLAHQGLMQAASAWPAYCEKHGFDPGCGQRPCANPPACGTRYFAAYAMRRMNGAILDAMRSSDWVTRSVRSRARRLRDAGQDLGRTDQELADASGMPVAQVRETLAGIARRPVSFDPALHDVEDLASAEGSVMMGSVLQAAVAAMHALSSAGQVILVFHYYLQRSLGQIAEDLGLTADRAAELHNEGVVAVHKAMARAARDGA